MSDPILSREKVDKLADCCFVHSNQLTPHQWRSFAARIEAALLEKVCGDPIYQIAFSDEDGWCDTHKKCYDEHPEHMRRIVYALTRSKP